MLREHADWNVRFPFVFRFFPLSQFQEVEVMVKKIVFYRKQSDPIFEPFFEFLQGFEVPPGRPEAGEKSIRVLSRVPRLWEIGSAGKTPDLAPEARKGLFPLPCFPDPRGSFTLNPKMG